MFFFPTRTQIRADDTLGEPYNTATTQLVIQLEDVNNTPPTLRLVSALQNPLTVDLKKN